MFSSYLFLPRPEHVLIVGLGGGSMVRFLEHHEPDLKIDVVEIDLPRFLNSENLRRHGFSDLRNGLWTRQPPRPAND